MLNLGGKSGLSMAFKRMMLKAGIKEKISRKRCGKEGRSVSLLSFDSLRHGFNSAMANAGVAPEIRQLPTGHASAEMNKVYTHHELETVRRAVESISGLPGKVSPTPQVRSAPRTKGELTDGGRVPSTA